MKKNRFMKTAGCLLILCLLTTCVIGTTFAKYVTSGDAQDSARVAKWGVTLEMAADPEIFSNEYTGTTVGGSNVTVSSTSRVVAPGTSQHTAAIFTITGTPEVAVNVKIELTNIKDVCLKAGTYPDETTVKNDTFTLDADYYPVVFTLKQIEAAGTAVDVTVATGTLATIKAKLEEYNANANYAPNTNLGAKFELTWTWAFGGNDQADTYLGNRIAKGETDPSKYNLEVGYTLKITVTQID